MASYNINKGVGRTVEFKGLKAQYLFIFAGGLLGALILIMVLYMVGVNTYLCLFMGVSSCSVIVWKTFSLNNKYGEHGMMKISAKRRHPQYIVCRKGYRRYVINHCFKTKSIK